MKGSTNRSRLKKILSLGIVLLFICLLPSVLMTTAEAVSMTKSPTDSEDNVWNVKNHEYAYDSSSTSFAEWNNGGDSADFQSFGTFNIPSGATVTSLQVSFIGYTEGRGLRVAIAPNGNSFGNEKLVSMTGTAQQYTLSGDKNYWGKNLNVNQLNSSLQVRVLAESLLAKPTTAYLTDLTVTVTYSMPIPAGDISASGYTSPYDGTGHTITVTAQAGDTITYGTTPGFYNLTSAPLYTDAGTYTVYYKVSRPYYDDYTGSETVTISKKALTITADDKSMTYGGTVPALTITENGLVGSDTLASLGISAYTLASSTSNAGHYSIMATGPVGMTNYLPTYNLGTLTINKAALTVTADDKSMTYGGAVPALTASTTGLVNSDTLSSLGISLSTTATSSSNTGTYTISVNGSATLPNYNPTYTDGTMTVNKATLSITADDKSMTYGGAVPALTDTTTGLVNSDTLSSLGISLSTTATSSSNSGTYTISVSGPATLANYTPTYNNGTLTVNKAALTVTADNKSMTYGTAVPALTATTTGLVNSDTLSSLGITLSTTATSSSNAGTYTISVNGSSTLTNYTPTYNNATLTINQASAAIVLDAGKLSQTYGAVSAVTATTTPAGLSYTVTYDGSTTLPSNAGTYAVVATINETNYTGSVSGTLTIGKATLTVTADDKSMTYGGVVPALTDTTTGLVNSDTLTSLGVSLSTTASSSSSAGTYTISVSGPATLANYTPTYNNGTMTVNKATLTVTADNKSMTYGTPVPALTAATTGLVNSDTLASLGITLSTTATSSSNVGTYTISVNGSAILTNYTPTYNDGTLTINQASAAIVLDAGTLSQTYGAVSAVTATTTPTGLSYTVTYDGSTTLPSNAGTYAVVATINETNYTGSVSGTLTIGKATLTVTADDKSMTYGGAVPALTDTTTGLVNSDTLSSLGISLGTTATSSSNAGTYTISVSGPATLANYTPTYNNGTLTINKAALTITADDKSMTYGGTVPALTDTTTGLVNSDTLSSLGISLGTTATSSSNAGTYTISVSGPATLANYTPTYNNGTLTVNKATLTVTADDKSMTYGEAVPALTDTTTGLVNGDTLSSLGISLGTTATSSSNAGTYTISVSGPATLANYTPTYNNGTLTVNKAALTITADDKSMTYGGAVPALTAATKGLVNGDTLSSLGITLSTTATSSSSVGTYTISINGASTLANYTPTYNNGTMTVNKAALTVTADDKSMTYGGTFPTLTDTTTGLVNGDTLASLSISLSTTATATSNAGTYTIFVNGSATLANYTPTYNNGTLTINPKSISTYTIDAIGTQIYNGNPITPAVTIGGLVQGTDFTVNYTNNAAVGRATATATGIGNYTGTTSTTFAINYGYVPPSGGGSSDGQATAAGDIELITTFDGNRVTITANLPSAYFDYDSVMQEIIDLALIFGAEDYIVIVNLNVPDAETGDFEFTLDGTQLADLAGSTEALLQVGSPLGSVRFDADSVESLSAQAGTNDVTVTISQTADYDGHPVYDITVSAGGTNITSFGGGEVTVTVPYTPTQDELDNGIVVYYMSSTGPVMVNNCTYDAETGMVSFVTNHLSEFAIGYIDAGASADDWYAEYLNYLASRDILDPATFSPNTNITRAEFVTILAAIDGADLSGYTSASFDDVYPSDAYFGAVEWAADNGIILGYNGYFSPSDSITRQDICTILMRYADLVDFILPLKVDAISFTDQTDIADYAAEAVSGMQQADILNGFPDKSFSPKSNTTQAQAAKIFSVFMQLMIEY